MGLVVGVAIAWAKTTSAPSTLTFVIWCTSSSSALRAGFAWDFRGIPVRNRCFACRPRDLFKSRSISDQVFDNMAAFHNICLNDPGLQAVDHLSEVEVYLAAAVLEGCVIHAILEVL